jgi:hypothetical protein
MTDVARRAEVGVATLFRRFPIVANTLTCADSFGGTSTTLSPSWTSWSPQAN